MVLSVKAERQDSTVSSFPQLSRLSEVHQTEVSSLKLQVQTLQKELEAQQKEAAQLREERDGVQNQLRYDPFIWTPPSAPCTQGTIRVSPRVVPKTASCLSPPVRPRQS